MSDQIFRKYSVGIPDDIIMIREELNNLCEEAGALVKQAIAIVDAAALAEKNREDAEQLRAENEKRRQIEDMKREAAFAVLMATLESYHAENDMIRMAVDALGALHSDHDYAYLAHSLHVTGDVFDDTGAIPVFTHATGESGILTLEDDIYGIIY